MPTQTPLTDEINALTTYANTVTGASDTCLSDAMETLAEGYGGGGYSVDQIASGDITGDIVITGTTLKAYAFAGKNITSVSAPNVETIGYVWVGGANFKDAVFTNCPNLVSASFAKLTELSSSFFGNCTRLASVYLPKVQTVKSNCFANNHSLQAIALPSYNDTLPIFGRMNNLLAFDFGGGTNILANAFKQNGKMNVLVLRSATMITLENISAFASTPFASNGTGGTLYVPQSLISSYQSASNWSTILGYANNQIKKIEGSIYETAYADGTPIE